MTKTTATDIAYFLAQGMHQQGCVRVAGLVIIEGHFQGDILADTVIIGASGCVEGSVQADTLLVQGRLLTSAARNTPLQIVARVVPALAKVPALRVRRPSWQERVLGVPLALAGRSQQPPHAALRRHGAHGQVGADWHGAYGHGGAVPLRESAFEARAESWVH